MPSLYRSVDAVALPSFREGLPRGWARQVLLRNEAKVVEASGLGGLVVEVVG